MGVKACLPGATVCAAFVLVAASLCQHACSVTVECMHADSCALGALELVESAAVPVSYSPL